MQKILIVDDTEGVRRMLVRQLKKLNYEALAVEGGKEALELLQSETVDLVLLDQMMPGMSGYEVCQEIRNNPAWRDMRIIMLTAKGGDIQREKGLSLGADEYVTKPFSTRELIARVFPDHVAAIVNEMSVLIPDEQETLGRLCRKLGKQDKS